MNDEPTHKEAKPVNDIKSKIDRMDLKYPKPRLITIIAIDNADGTFELIYGFHYNNQYTDVRYTVKADDELESLSSYYAGAVNMEREIVDMMGLHFKGIEGGLLLTPEKGIVTPLRKPLKPAVTAPPASAAAVSTATPAPQAEPKEVKL
ncbi:MAG TPA: NADH-quinone oxidoreductase subunit C [Methanomassiliicoccales archaeon]|jgi:NADH:ubiquinone oxidoreductase subunit C